MKKPSEDLFILIKSMTKEEKRYFKLFAKNIGGKSSNYTLLFDAIARQQEYDEAKIKRKFKGEKFVKQLNVTKRYLYKLLLRALQNFHGTSRIEDEILDGLRQVGVLYARRLYKLARKQLQDLKKLAILHEMVFYLPRIYAWEVKMENDVFAYANHSESDFEALHQAYQNAVDLTTNYIEYHYAISKLFFLSRRVGYTRKLKEQCQAIIDNPLFESIELAKTNDSKFFLLGGKAMYYALLRDYPNALIQAQQMITIFDQNPIYKEHHLVGYISALNNTMMISTYTNDWAELHRCEQRVRALLEQSLLPILRNKVQLALFRSTLRMHAQRGTFEEGLKVAEEAQKFLEESTKDIAIEASLPLIYFMACIHFTAGQFDKALDHINYISDKGNDLFPTLYGAAQILTAIIYYEMEETLMLPYSLRSLYRYLDRKKELFPFEKELLKFLKKLSANIPASKISQILTKAQNKLEKFVARASAEDKEPLSYFNYGAWIKSKLSQRSFAEILREEDAVTAEG